MDTFQIAVVVTVMSAAIVGMIFCRRGDEKCESDEIEDGDVDLTPPSPPEVPIETDGTPETAPMSALLKDLQEFPGSHRKAKVFPGHHWSARYQTARGGWSRAKVITIFGDYALLRRQGTEFVRTWTS